jgi:hypothetical protein
VGTIRGSDPVWAISLERTYSELVLAFGKTKRPHPLRLYSISLSVIHVLYPLKDTLVPLRLYSISHTCSLPIEGHFSLMPR